MIALAYILLIILGIIIGTISAMFTYAKHIVKENTSGRKTVRYSNGDSATLFEIYSGKVPSDSVFSPYNQDWYFEFEGYDVSGKQIFASSWNTIPIMRQRIQAFEKIVKFEVVVVDDAKDETRNTERLKKLTGI